MITVTLVCGYCKNTFNRTDYPSRFVKYHSAYCSKRCALLGAREQFRPTQGLVLADNGHLMARAPWHPNRNKNNQVPLAHLLLEDCLGRYLTENEVVHHIDGDPLNNSLRNLQLMTLSSHVKLHNLTRKRGQNGQFLKIVP